MTSPREQEAREMLASDFDPASLREIPVWMVRDMGPGWQKHGTTAYHGADAIERLQAALAQAVADLRTVGDDYPGSSCHQWCHERADAALATAIRNPLYQHEKDGM